MTFSEEDPSVMENLNPLRIDAPPLDDEAGTQRETNEQELTHTIEARVPDSFPPDQLQNDLQSASTDLDSEQIQTLSDGQLLHLHVSQKTIDQILSEHSPGDHPRFSFWKKVQTTIENTKNRNRSLTFPDRGTMDLSGRPALMGVLNVTPDSFSDGGLYFDEHDAVNRATILQREGASIIDVGGESTRPGADPVSAEDETNRVCPVIERIVPKLRVPVSIDTQKPAVAQAALNAGAEMINDVGGLQRQPELIEIARDHEVPAVAMHMQGTPENMQENPSYDDVIRDIASFLRRSRRKAVSKGLDPDQLILDPGIGFGKTQNHNLTLLRNLHEFKSLGSPLMLGTSRKSFLGRILGTPVDERIEGTAASLALPVLRGLSIARVHDVESVRRFLKVLWTLHGPTSWQDELINSNP